MDIPAAQPKLSHIRANSIFWQALIFPFGLYAAWIGAWLVETRLAAGGGWIASSAGQSLYWLATKLLLWVLPAAVLIRRSGRSLEEVMGLSRIRTILIWGGGAGLLLVLLKAAASALITHAPIWPPALGWAFFGAVIVSPVVEEITFRGAVLPGLQQRLSFSWANTLTAALFVGAHLPGWAFQGRLWPMLGDPAGGALSIFLVGWLFGLVAQRSNSVAAGAFTHVLNNLF